MYRIIPCIYAQGYNLINDKGEYLYRGLTCRECLLEYLRLLGRKDFKR